MYVRVDSIEAVGRQVFVIKSFHDKEGTKGEGGTGKDDRDGKWITWRWLGGGAVWRNRALGGVCDAGWSVVMGRAG
ncbi:hypothetical protein Tco_0575019 [Tanacetum coccineum]